MIAIFFSPGQDVGHAQTDGPARDGRRLVPLSPRLRLLAFRSRHQHAAVLRGSVRSRRCCRC